MIPQSVCRHLFCLSQTSRIHGKIEIQAEVTYGCGDMKTEAKFEKKTVFSVSFRSSTKRFSSKTNCKINSSSHEQHFYAIIYIL